MDKVIATIGAFIFVLFVLGFLGFFIYTIFNNTPYPDEEPSTESLTSILDVPITDPQDLTQLTLQHMQEDVTKLSRGYLLPPPRTKFQCLLPSLRQ